MFLLRLLKSIFIMLSFGILSFFILGCDTNTIVIKNGDLLFDVNEELHTRISVEGASPLMEQFQCSEYIVIHGKPLTQFRMDAYHFSIGNPQQGGAEVHTFTGNQQGIQKKVVITSYPDIPGLLTTQVRYTNLSRKDIAIESWTNNHYHIVAQEHEPPFWAFQGSSSPARADWIKPIHDGYYQRNFMGMNSSDYGGGIPVTDIWRKDVGVLVGQGEVEPRLLSLPTEMKKYDNVISISVHKDLGKHHYLAPGDSLDVPETFVAIHKGDYYNGLEKYARLMQKKGMDFPESEPAAFEPIWCAWGYERDFTVKEVIGTLPKVKELGIKWAVIDDGYQQAEGDWHVNREKFPGGGHQVKELVKTIHGYGLKAKIWWAPLAADPQSRLLEENPDMRLYLEDWAPQYITWWDAYYLSPFHPKTIEHTTGVLDLFMNEWNFDGLKMDGQHMNAIAPDYNPKSKHQGEKAVEAFPGFYELIFNHVKKIKPHAVVENCPCGTCMSFFNMPYMNQAVSSDPTSSWQIRLKGKTYKALIPNTAYYGDHVELSDGGEDFASSLGIGAVLGTKFTWPGDNPAASYLLTPNREKKWKKWFSLYNQKMLSKEEYLGHLYDLGYDKPETHVIQKGDTLHYAFYADHWQGTLELRGLSQGYYVVNDYFNAKGLGVVDHSNPKVDVKFDDFLLLEVYPDK